LQLAGIYVWGLNLVCGGSPWGVPVSPVDFILRGVKPFITHKYNTTLCVLLLTCLGLYPG